jgi:fatty acid desaturase
MNLRTGETLDRTAPPARPPGPQGWWSPSLERAAVQKLLARRDLPGLLYFCTWLMALTGTTLLLAAAWGTWAVLPVLFLHGAVLSFSYAASHECAHGTAFRSVWLNEAVFYLTSFIFGEEPMYRRYTHGRHHSSTWYPGFDIQMPYGNPMSLRTYLRETLALGALLSGARQTLRLALGRLTAEEKSVIPAAKIRQLVWGARAFLAGYVAVIAIALITRSWFIIVALPGARLAGGWIVQLFINSQHMCMAEAVADHRYSTRSMACTLPTRILYWNMNYHVEHHLYPGVPFHALPAVNALVRDQMPHPTRGAAAANAEILAVIRRQMKDPTHVSVPRFAADQSDKSLHPDQSPTLPSR